MSSDITHFKHRRSQGWGDGLLNPFALTRKGRVVHAEDADRDRDQPFRCEECREQLILKAGNVRRHHFAHEASASDRDCQPLAAFVRRYAVELLVLSDRLQLPARQLDGVEVLAARVANFETVVVPDRRVDGDVVVLAGTLSLRVYLQVRGTDQARVTGEFESAVSLDLRAAPVSDPRQLEDFILDRSPRHWIRHRRDRELQEIVDAKRAEERRAFEAQQEAARVEKAKRDRWAEEIEHRRRDAANLAGSNADQASRGLAAGEIDVESGRMEAACALLRQHQPTAALSHFMEKPQDFLGGKSAREYNGVRSDLVAQLERWLGLRDQFFRPLK